MGDIKQDATTAKGMELSYAIIGDLALGKDVPSNFKDKVYISLCTAVCEFLNAHPRFFDGLACDPAAGGNIREAFLQVASELLEVDGENEPSDRRLVWGRIIALFAFAVRLALENRNKREIVDEVKNLLGSYIVDNAIPYIKTYGGWDTLVEDYPPPENIDDEMRQKMMRWWGVCVGMAAVMYFTCGRH